MQKERGYNGTFDAHLSGLVGKTLTSVVNDNNDVLRLTASDGSEYRMIYYQDCCAHCSIEDVCGDLNDLVGSPILLAEEVSSQEPDSAALEAHIKVETDKNVITAEIEIFDDVEYKDHMDSFSAVPGGLILDSDGGLIKKWSIQSIGLTPLPADKTLPKMEKFSMGCD